MQHVEVGRELLHHVQVNERRGLRHELVQRGHDLGARVGHVDLEPREPRRVGAHPRHHDGDVGAAFAQRHLGEVDHVGLERLDALHGRLEPALGARLRRQHRPELDGALRLERLIDLLLEEHVPIERLRVLA